MLSYLMKKNRVEWPPKFILNQAIYDPNGVKLGWVSGIVDNFNGFTGHQQATLSTIKGTVLKFTTDHLREGTILNRDGLKTKGITRQPVEYPVSIGNRLWQGGTIFKGGITQILAHSPADFVAHTDLAQAIQSFSILAGAITVGRRKHNALVT